METRFFTIKRENCNLHWHFTWWGFGPLMPIVTIATPWFVLCIWDGSFEPGGYERALAKHDGGMP